MCSYPRKLVVLVVDDDPEVENVLRLIFTLHGYDTIGAFDSGEALQVARRHSEPIDLLVTDVLMPGKMNGVELAVRLIGERPGLRVVLTSALDFDQLGCESLLLLPKPFMPEQVCALVEQVLAAPPPIAEALHEILRPLTEHGIAGRSLIEEVDAQGPVAGDRGPGARTAAERS